MKRVLAYSSIGQIGYVIIGISVGELNVGYASMINKMIFCISMNLVTFVCTVPIGQHIKTDKIRDYARLYTKAFSGSLQFCLLSLEGLPPLPSFFRKLLFYVSCRQACISRSQKDSVRALFLSNII